MATPSAVERKRARQALLSVAGAASRWGQAHVALMLAELGRTLGGPPSRADVELAALSVLLWLKAGACALSS